MWKWSAATTLCLCVFFQNLYAADGTFTRIHHQYQSPRSMAMGDAHTAVANDYTTLFYNPAGLARLLGGQINLSLDFAVSTSFIEFSKDLNEVNKIEGTEAEKFTAYSEFLKKYYGKYFMMRTGLFEAFWVRPNWGVALIPIDLTVEYQIHNQVAPGFELRAIGDTTLAWGYGKDIKGVVPGRWSVGTTLKFVNRTYINKSFSAWDLAADSNIFNKEDARDGYTMDADLGTLYTPELPSEGLWGVLKTFKPTFGLVLRNAVGMGFSRSFHLLNKNEVEAPEKLYRVVDVGTKFEFPTLWIFGGRFAVDLRDLGHPNVNSRKSLHMGAEFDWAMTNWWKGSYGIGYNQGYLTYGLSAKLFIFNLDLVSYGEDVGTFDSPQENRMYMVKLNMDF